MASPFSFQFPEHVTNLLLKSPKYIKASDETPLAYYSFVPAKPDSIIIFYHGGGAWSTNIYQYMARQLEQQHNIGVYLFDIRGHGNSQGPRGDAPSTQQVWQDISYAINFAQQKHPLCPIFLGGHSSGAGLVLNYSNWNQHKTVSGYILLSPFLGVQSKTAYEHNDPEKRFVKNIRLFPLILNAITNGFLFPHTPVIFFNYPEVEKQKDPLLLEYYTGTMAQATTPYDAQKLFKQLDKPFVLLIGENDEQFIPEKIIAFHQHAILVKDHSTSKIVPDVTHLSMVIDAPSYIAQEIQKILND